nr:MAG TPA: putative tail component [Caudoviricetes sp.]
MSIDRLDSLLKKIDRLEEIPSGALRVSVARQIQTISGEAKLLCQENSGELRQSIHSYSEVIEGGVRGTCYTTKKYAPYVEFGTGPEGEANHQGISPAITPSYVQHGWGIPAYAIDRNDAVEKYHFREGVYEDSNGFQYLYYYTNGQPAHPFMYPALKNNEDKVVKSLSADLQKEIKKV